MAASIGGCDKSAMMVGDLSQSICWSFCYGTAFVFRGATRIKAMREDQWGFRGDSGAVGSDRSMVHRQVERGGGCGGY